MAIDFDKLQDLLNHQFSDLELVRLALTHRSANKLNNERLEFLGDSLLGYIVAESLFELFPDASEGQLSRMRSNIVNKSTLAEIAQELQLSEFIQLGAGELKSGGRQRESILADAVEAIIAALYLDGGMDACKRLVRSWSEARMTTGTEKNLQKDSKTRLQEYMQAQGLDLPLYEVIEIHGEAHRQTFNVECRVSLLELPVHGTGSSKRIAEQHAASKAMEKLGESP
ncbi:MAG: ribonuclease III [Gammaproteobacteria bacterium]|jgi:ribonuclease-3|nr:ribonuclease III [Gammaproteobacteria bacterium]MDP6734057.1 ribonuclease III [Gammaproteobacteria bacterium]